MFVRRGEGEKASFCMENYHGTGDVVAGLAWVRSWHHRDECVSVCVVDGSKIDRGDNTVIFDIFHCYNGIVSVMQGYPVA